MKKIASLLFLVITIIACKNDDSNELGNLNIDFKNTINTTPLVLNTETYTNSSNEDYTVSELKYIISNISLIKANGEEFVYPVDQSYFVINEGVVTSKSINLTGINIGDYSKIRFGFGVDQSNYPLNGMTNFIPTAEENGMLWSWSAGYKFLKFEGTYTPQGGTQDDYILHVGSHGSTLDNYKVITLDLPSVITISEANAATISINANVAKIFDGTNTHSLATKSDIQVDPVYAPILAENVSTIFTINN